MKEYKKTHAWQDSVKLTTALARLTAKFESKYINTDYSRDILLTLNEKLVFIPVKIAYAYQQNTLDAFVESMSIAMIYLNDVTALLKTTYQKGFITQAVLNNLLREVRAVYLVVQKQTSLSIYLLAL